MCFKRINRLGNQEILRKASGWGIVVDKDRQMSDRVLLKVVKTNITKTLSENTSLYKEDGHYPLSNRSFQRVQFYGYFRRVVKKTTTIATRNWLKRRAFARSHLHWRAEEDWPKVFFLMKLKL